MNLNVVIISGRLGQKPELQTSKSGTEYVSFSVAVNRLAKKGEEPKTDWISVKAFNATAVYLSNYSDKGDYIVVKGRLDVSKVEDKTYYSIVADTVEIKSKSGNSAAPADEAIMEPVATDDLPF